MKALRHFAIALAVAPAMFVVPAVAQGQAPAKLPPTIAAIVDNAKVQREATAWESARQQVQQISQGYQQEFQREEERLRNEEQELARQRTVLSPDAFEQRRRDWERRAADFQQRVNERRRGLEQSMNSVRTDIFKRQQEVINEIARDRAFNLVLDKSVVAFSADALDITPEVVRKLNQKMPSVKVTPPAR
jgi:Skp family chaperone for outer membrane proteins